MSTYYPEGWIIDTPSNKYYLKNLQTLYDAFQTKKTLEAHAIVCDSTHNLIVDLGCIKGIIPREEVAIGILEGTTKDIAIISKVNKPVLFKITNIVSPVNEEPYAILSRKILQEECISNYISGLKPGDIIDAKITHIEAFGCFVDIGCGVASLLPIDAISVSRISHPTDRFRVGDNIKAVVKSIDNLGRVCLSHKELLGTWEENANLFEVGETVAGVIRSIENYGIFVELTPNLAGLAEPKDNVFPGQQASVFIKNLIPDKMKVKLIIVDSFDEIYKNSPPEYFVRDKHIDYWCYSPFNSEKLIETDFSNQNINLSFV
ncbi:MAG: 30S ribosomal protein S1 [Oscillospiraceae bacterium]|nr:30S ribosomal protein S1 [Oscillospiraceae bacterium]